MTHGQVFVGLLISLIAGPVPPTVSAADMQADQIARIEAQLEPSVQIYGRPIKAHTLSEAMAAHHTPAVSIAVVDNGIIIWAKAYGMADVASHLHVRNLHRATVIVWLNQ
jgi:CubicO group peptidase (beta-lactamase class C family)